MSKVSEEFDPNTYNVGKYFDNDVDNLPKKETLKEDHSLSPKNTIDPKRAKELAYRTRQRNRTKFQGHEA